MSTMAELLGDEISDFSQHVKPEEEIMKYSTADDMGEVKRAVYLLKKGYQSQKISIIENLHMSVHEAWSNEELIPIILSSMEIWDMNMQKECAKSFQKSQTLKAMNPANQVKLMDELLNIIMNVDITQEEFVEEWLKVFKALCPFLTIEYLRYTVIKRISDLPSLKQTLPWRKVGFSMFWSIIMAKGEELLKDEPLAIKIINSMCGDNNWRIRKEGAQYMAEFLKELHKLKPMQTGKNQNSIFGKNQQPKRQLSLFGTFSPNSGDMNEDSFSFTDAANGAINMPPGGGGQPTQPEDCKITKQRFRDTFYELLADLTADTELLVRQEGILMFIDMLPYVTKADLEQDFLPRLKETLEDMTKDDLADDDAEIRMINNLGNIADKLAKCGYLKPTFSDEFRLDKTLLEYFKACMSHQVLGVRKGAAYNLPCFYLYFRFWEPNLESSFNEFDDSRVFLDKYYFDLCQDPNTPLDILVTLASGIHEILQLFPQDQKLPIPIQESLKFLLNSPNWEIKEVLVKNLHKIIKAFWRKEEQQIVVEEVKNFYDDAIKKGPDIFKARKQQNLLISNLNQQLEDNKQSVVESDTGSNASSSGTQQSQKSQPSPRRKGKKVGASDTLISAGTTIGFGGGISSKNDIAQSKLEGIYAVYLQTIIDIEVCPEEFHYEYLYSRFLEYMMPLIVSILNDKTKWRVQETFITNLGNSIGCFNALEIQELILPKILEKIRVQNDQVKQACCCFIANLISNQYKKKQRKGLIDMMINDYGKSKTFSLRKTFIMFCSSAIKVLSYQTFKQHFFELYLSLSSDKVPDVRITFLNSVCNIRPYLELDPPALNLFNVALSNFLMDTSQTVFELTGQIDLKLLKLKRQPFFGATKQEETNRINAETKLKERDQNEEDAKVKVGDSTKNKLEFLTTALQLQTMLGRKPGGAFGGAVVAAPMKKLPGLSKTGKKMSKDLSQAKGNATGSKTEKQSQNNSVVNGGQPQKSNDQLSSQQQTTQQQTGNSVIQQNNNGGGGIITTLSDKNGSLIQKFKKRVKKENNSILPPILGGSQQVPGQTSIQSGVGSSSGATNAQQSNQTLSQNSQTQSASQLKTIRKVDINISAVISKDSTKQLETPPLTSTTPSVVEVKESLLIPTSKTSEKRLSFKDGSALEEVAKTYQSNQSMRHRRSLVPRHSVSMSPMKKDQLNEIKLAAGSNTEAKPQGNEDQRNPVSQLPLNLINQNSSGGTGASIPHEVKQILWRNSIITKIKDSLSSQIMANLQNQNQALAQVSQQSVTPHSASQPSLFSGNSTVPPTINTGQIVQPGFQQQFSLTPNASSMNNKDIEQNNFASQNKPGTSNIFQKRRISNEELDFFGKKNTNEETENQISSTQDQPVFSMTGALPRATNNALIPRQSRVMRAPPQFSQSPGPSSTNSQFQLSPSGIVYNGGSGGSPAPISKNVMPMRPPYFMQQKEISLQQQQQNASAGSSHHLLPPLAQYLKNRNTNSRAQHYSHQTSQQQQIHSGHLKTNDNNSDILVVKLHGVAEVMNESKSLAAVKRAQSSGGSDQNMGLNPRIKINANQPEQPVDNQNMKRPDSYQNKVRGQAAIVQQQIQQNTLGIPGQLANTRNAVQAKAVKSYSDFNTTAGSSIINSDSRQQNNYLTIAPNSGQSSSQQMWNSQERKGISHSGHHSSTGTLNTLMGGGSLGPIASGGTGSRLISPKTQLGGTAQFGNVVHIKERKV